MKPDIKKRWVEALLSGDYTQGTLHLNSGGRFCVMGVLCDLYCKETGKEWEPFGSGGEYYRLFGKDGQLPYQVDEWCGEDVSWHPVPYPGWSGRSFLSTMNDRGMTFHKLAAIIQEQL